MTRSYEFPSKSRGKQNEIKYLDSQNRTIINMERLMIYLFEWPYNANLLLKKKQQRIEKLEN